MRVPYGDGDEQKVCARFSEGNEYNAVTVLVVTLAGLRQGLMNHVYSVCLLRIRPPLRMQSQNGKELRDSGIQVVAGWR